MVPKFRFWKQYRIDIHRVMMIFKDTSAPVLSKQKVLLKVSKTWVVLSPMAPGGSTWSGILFLYISA